MLRLLLIATLLAVGCGRQEQAPKELYNRLLNVRCLAFSPDGRLLVAGRSRASGGGGSLLIWDKGGEGAMRELPSHSHDVVSVAFTPSQLLSAGYEGQIKLWKTSDWSEASKFSSTPWLASMDPSNDSTLAVLHGPGRDTMQPKQAEVQIWDHKLARLKSSFPTPGATDLAFSPNGQRVATVMTDSSVTLWNLDGSAVGKLSTPVTRLDFSPDGRTLAGGGTDGVVTLWNADTAQKTGSLPSLGQRITCLRYSPDGTKLAYGCEGHLVLSSGGKVVWDKPAAQSTEIIATVE